MPLWLALAACGGRYELGEVLPLEPSGAPGAGQIASDPRPPSALGRVLIDEPEDLDASLTQLLYDPAGDMDGDGYDDWFATPPSGLWSGPAPGQYDLSLVYGGPRIAGDLYREDRLGPLVTYASDWSDGEFMPTAAGDVDGDGFGDLLVSSEQLTLIGLPPEVKARFLAQWGEQRAYILYGGPRGTSSTRIRLSEAAVSFAPLEAVQTSFSPEQVLASSSEFIEWTADQRLQMASLGDLDGDGFGDFAYTHGVVWNAIAPGKRPSGPDDPAPRDPAVGVIAAHTDAVSYVFYGGPSRLPSDNPLASAAAVLPGVTALRQIGDIDGDGHPDLVARKNGQLFLIPGGVGRLSGSLAAEQLSAAPLPADGKGPRSLALTREVDGVGDLDADGFDDLMVTRSAGSDSAALLFYGGPHRLEQPLLDANADATFLIAEAQSSQALHGLGDWDGDGYEDLLVVREQADGDRQVGWQNERWTAVILPGGAERYSGVLSASMLAAAPDHRGLSGVLGAVPFGDVDGDGHVDLQVVHDGELFVKYGGSIASVIR